MQLLNSWKLLVLQLFTASLSACWTRQPVDPVPAFAAVQLLSGPVVPASQPTDPSPATSTPLLTAGLLARRALLAGRGVDRAVRERAPRSTARAVVAAQERHETLAPRLI